MAEHIVDPGPTFEAHAPILQEAMEILEKAGLLGLEFGREVAYMKEHHASREGPFTCAAGKCQRYVLDSGGYRIALVTTVAGDRSTEVHIKTPAGRDLRLAYDAYETGLPIRPELFELPKGLRVRERK